MKTRRAAKTTTENGTPSVNGSAEDDQSRRGSLDDLRPITSYSNGSQLSAKSRRLSEASLPTETPNNDRNGFHPPEQAMSPKIESMPSSPVQETDTPSRKRKRSPSSDVQQPSTPQALETVVDTSFENNDVSPSYADDVDTVDVVPLDDLSDREVSSSQGSSRSEAIDVDQKMVDAPSVDVTPAISDPVSPATSESDSQGDMPLAKPLNAALEVIAREAEQDAEEVVEDVDEADDVDDQVRSDDDGRPRRGRFGGRRRARHPIPHVEAALQRQSTLKTAYRAIARVQKAVLAEIGQRTTDDLEADLELHTKVAEYDGVKDGLAARVEERQRHLQSQHELNMQQLKSTLESEQRVLKSRCKQQLEDLQEVRLNQLEYQFLSIARAAQLGGADAGYETENEDDVVPKPKGMGYRWKRTDALDRAYDSRSRLALETVRATDDMEKRFDMRKFLESINEEDRPEGLTGFTVMDTARRERALERREGVETTNTLANAAAEAERIASIPVIRNEEALGLQLLGDLASRPSITHSASKLAQPKRSRNSSINQTPPRPRPPPLQLQTNHAPGPTIPVEMSPRTTQAMGDRFETSMPPPMTPQQAATPFIGSPEAMRIEQHAFSPSMDGYRTHNLYELNARSSDGRPQSHAGTSAERRDDPSDQQLQQPASATFDRNRGPLRLTDQAAPLWRSYPEQSLSNRRKSEHSERPPFQFPGGSAVQRERHNFAEPRTHDGPQGPVCGKDDTLPRSHLFSRPPLWPDPSGHQVPADARQPDFRSPAGEPPRPVMGVPRSPRSRKSSISLSSAREYRPPNPHGDNQNRQKHKGSKSTFVHKSNKEERGGLPRRHWKHEQRKNDQRKLSRSIGIAGSAGSPTAGHPPYAGSPDERASHPSPWPGPPVQHSPPVPPPPPSAPYPQQHSPYGVPSQPRYAPNSHGYEYNHHHRNSFPLPPHPPPWHQPPPSPLYAVPQSQHPPPPGVPPEQLSRFAPPPPPASLGYPPLPPPPPPFTPQSAPGAYGQQFGGPPLAPAITHPGYHPSGFGHPPHDPAFAQQARQQQNHHGPRRRTVSDASHLGPKVIHYFGPNGKH